MTPDAMIDHDGTGTCEQVAELLPILQKFVDTGEI